MRFASLNHTSHRPSKPAALRMPAFFTRAQVVRVERASTRPGRNIHLRRRLVVTSDQGHRGRLSSSLKGEKETLERSVEDLNNEKNELAQKLRDSKSARKKLSQDKGTLEKEVCLLQTKIDAIPEVHPATQALDDLKEKSES